MNKTFKRDVLWSLGASFVLLVLLICASNVSALHLTTRRLNALLSPGYYALWAIATPLHLQLGAHDLEPYLLIALIDIAAYALPFLLIFRAIRFLRARSANGPLGLGF